MFATDQISVFRGCKAILDRVSIQLNPGDLNVILGPNGAGKSTLLQALTRTLTPDQGEVFLDGTPLRKLPFDALARRRAVLAQESFLQFDFSVEEVVLLGRIPHLSGWESDHDREICSQALHSVEMEAFRHRRYPSLSGGEKQRVHLARVLAQLEDQRGPTDPAPWLMLDEPTSALDLRHQHSVLGQARKLAKIRGFGVCAVLHDINLALHYADQVVLMDQGRVVAQGSPSETLTAERISDVYQVQAQVLCASNCPFIQIQSHHEKHALKV